MASKVQAWYAGFAILLTNTVLVTVVTLLLLDVAADSLSESHVYSRAFKPQSYALSTPEEAKQIAVEFDLMGERESYAFNPWTTFTERPFEGTLVNVDQSQSYPTRRTIHQQPTDAKAGGREVTVWAFGGSTMLGWGVSDRNTVASHLQAKMQTALPDVYVRIINHGHAYYFSSLEVSLMVAMLRQDDRPDIVLFLDGLNDVNRISARLEEPYFAPQAEAAWEAERTRRYDPQSDDWVTFGSNFPPFRVARHLNLMGSVEPNSEIQTLKGADVAARVVEVMDMNRKMARSIGDALDVETYFFLQPVPEKRMEWDSYSHAYPALREAASNDAHLHDISQPLEKMLEHPYVDASHYSDRGCLAVAERLAKVILTTSQRL